MNNATEQTADTQQIQTYKSPTDMFKGRLLSLLFECIMHHSKALNDNNEVYAFARKAWDLSILLEKYTPRSNRAELIKWRLQLKDDIKEVRGKDEKDGYTPTDKTKDILNLEFNYAEEIHMHNTRILINSPVLEVEIEGDLDVTDDNIIGVVRLKKRTDDGKLIFKH